MGVYDRAPAGPPIRLDRRLVTVARAKKDGTRAVLELLALDNPGRATRVTNDTTRPTWRGARPRGVIQVAPGQGDVSGEAVGQQADSDRVGGPSPPGHPQPRTEPRT